MSDIEQLQSLLRLALDHGKVFVHLNPKRGEVSLPDYLLKEERVALVLSRRYPNVDLHFGDDALSATLRFSGTPHRCVIPWGAVLAVVPAKPVPVPSKAPEITLVEPTAAVEPSAPPSESKPRRRPALRLVVDDD